MILQKKDKDNRIIYYIPPSSKSNGIHLYEYEIVYLKQLLKYGVVRGLELNEFVSTLRGREKHSNTNAATKARLQCLRKAGLIRSFQNELQKGHKSLYQTYYSTYTKITLDVLLEIEVITQAQYDEYLKRLKYIQQDKIAAVPKLHSTAIIKIGLILHVNLTETLEEGDFELVKGVHHPLFSKNLQQKLQTPLIFPDLLLELPGKVLLAFEVDGGKQGREVILDKANRYEQFMKNEHMKDYSLRLIFMPIDNELLEEEGRKNVSARIMYIKDLFASVETSYSFEVYCYRFKQLHAHVKKAIFDVDRYEVGRAEWFANYWIELAKKNLDKVGYTVEPIKINDILPHSFFAGYAPHAIAKVEHEHRYNNSYYLLFFMYTGHAKSSQIFNNIQRSLKGVRQENLDIRILLVYPNCNHREADTLKLLEDNFKYVHATSIEEVEQLNQNNNEEFPLYQYSSEQKNYSVKNKNVQF